MCYSPLLPEEPVNPRGPGYPIIPLLPGLPGAPDQRLQSGQLLVLLISQSSLFLQRPVVLRHFFVFTFLNSPM